MNNSRTTTWVNPSHNPSLFSVSQLPRQVFFFIFTKQMTKMNGNKKINKFSWEPCLVYYVKRKSRVLYTTVMTLKLHTTCVTLTNHSQVLPAVSLHNKRFETSDKSQTRARRQYSSGTLTLWYIILCWLENKTFFWLAIKGQTQQRYNETMREADQQDVA